MEKFEKPTPAASGSESPCLAEGSTCAKIGDTAISKSAIGNSLGNSFTCIETPLIQPIGTLPAIAFSGEQQFLRCTGYSHRLCTSLHLSQPCTDNPINRWYLGKRHGPEPKTKNLTNGTSSKFQEPSPGQLGEIRMRSKPPKSSTTNAGDNAGTAAIALACNSNEANPFPLIRPTPAATKR